MMYAPEAAANGENASIPPTRRMRKALAVRRALFDSGLRAFDRQPIGLVSVLDITEGADVAKGVFYLHFRSRDEFLLALWEDVRTSLLNRLRSACEHIPAVSDRVREVANQYVRFVYEASASARFWIRMASFFDDEIGGPGQLEAARDSFLRELAAIVAGKPAPSLTRADLELGLRLDGCAWGLLRSVMQHGGAGEVQTGHVELIAMCASAEPPKSTQNPGMQTLPKR